jgi:hypothetical protein
MTRRLAILFLLILGVACGGPNTRLVTVKAGMGDGAHKVVFSVKNLTDVPINTFYLAKTAAVDKAGGPRLDPNSPEGAEVWGPDLGGGALQVGKTEAVDVQGPGIWDARAVDREGREQIITGLKLQAGGVYVLELYENGWRNFGP